MTWFKELSVQNKLHNYKHTYKCETCGYHVFEKDIPRYKCPCCFESMIQELKSQNRSDVHRQVMSKSVTQEEKKLMEEKLFCYKVIVSRRNGVTTKEYLVISDSLEKVAHKYPKASVIVNEGEVVVLTDLKGT